MSSLDHMLSNIALLPDGEHLCVAPEVDSAEIDAITEHRAYILKQLRQTQIDGAGFYIVLPDVLEREIRAARTVVFCVEVTARTRYSAAERISAPTMIGRQSWRAYRALEPGVLASCAPRIRALALQLDGLGTCCFEWDRLPASHKARLLDAFLTKKLIVGHDAGQQLSWIFGET